MGYLGQMFGPEPSGTPLKRVMASNPSSPGVMQKHFYTDPTSGTYNVESPDGQNVVLASGNNLSFQNGGAYYSNSSQTSYPYPKIVPAGGPFVSGYNGALYPYQYNP